jgi:ribosomal protein L21E
VLVKIVRLPQPAGSNDGSGKDGTTTTTPTVSLYATGSITALTDGAISVHGDRDTTCTRGPSSPTLGDYKVGDKVTIACVNGVLSGIAKSSSPPPPPPPPPPPAPTANDYTTGSIVAITDGSISVHGDRDTTCTRGASSPKLGDYKVGDRVTIGCAGGVLAGIVRTS